MDTILRKFQDMNLQSYTVIRTPDGVTVKMTFHYNYDPEVTRTHLGTYRNGFINESIELWVPGHAEEHQIVAIVREAVLQYRLQSPILFEVSISVNQPKRSKYGKNPTQMYPAPLIQILFADFSTQRLLRQCRVQPDRGIKQIQQVTAELIQVRDASGWISLQDFLIRRFPALGDSATGPTMPKWWDENGRHFPWAKLPTEIKERIISSCMHNKIEGAYTSMSKYLSKKRQPRRQGPHEVTDQLGNWSALLGVSHQVRSLTVRLCLGGSRDMAYDAGLCLISESVSGLKDSFKRLGKCYQMVESGGVPVDQKSLAQADLYLCYPRIYPDLNRFATFRHGIRKIHLMWDFHTFLSFFRVTAGGFYEHWRNQWLDYTVLEQLPHLNQINISLPNAETSWNRVFNHPGPQIIPSLDLFCPRLIHRLIYEQVAKVLASYPDLRMFGFMDKHERNRYQRLRQKAVNALKFKPEELRELYADDQTGGIELEKSVIPGSQVKEAEEEVPLGEILLDNVGPAFWPPKCRCNPLCRVFIVEGNYSIFT